MFGSLNSAASLFSTEVRQVTLKRSRNIVELSWAVIIFLLSAGTFIIPATRAEL